MIIQTYIAYRLPKPYREIFQGFSIAVEGSVVNMNACNNEAVSVAWSSAF